MGAIGSSRSEAQFFERFRKHYVKGPMNAKLICRLLALVCLGAGYAMAQTSVPDTPAGHTLQAWLDAFDSGDRAKIESYVKTVDQKQNVDGMMSLRTQIGGFELIGI